MKVNLDVCRNCCRYYEIAKNGNLYLVCMNAHEVGNGYVIDKNFIVPEDCYYRLEQLLYDTAQNNPCPICGSALTDDLKCPTHGDV